MIRLPTASKLRRLAGLVEITSQDSKQSAPFVLNAEQEQLSAELLTMDNPRAIVLKSRQIGTSTYFCFLDVIIALINPGIKVALVVDTQAKATELLGRCKAFAKGMGLRLLVENTRKMQLQNKSEIHAITATGGADGTESKAGRGLTYQWLHLSELPYWSNQAAYGALLATSSGAPVIVESTAKGTGDLFWRLWATDNEYRKVFFSVEQHASYQLDPASISDAQWIEAQSLGFTSRPHAAYWYRALANQGGDLLKHLHDYPVKPEHSFLAYEGRWITRDPVVTAYTTSNRVKIFRPKEQRHRYIAAVDTSGGVGRDGNAVTVFDQTTAQLCAFWKDNTADIETVTEVLVHINRLYEPDQFVIETNGIGQATYQRAVRAALPVRAVVTTEASKYAGLLAAKRAIEAGTLYGPEELAEEAASLHLNIHGKFRGKKDALMCAGFALTAIADNPYTIPEKIDTQNIYIPPDLRANQNWY